MFTSSKLMLALGAVLAVGLGLFAPQATLAQSQGTAQVPESAAQVKLSYAPLVKQVAPTVVNIFTTKIVESRRMQSPLFNDPFFQRFFGEGFGRPQKREENSLGSGVIVQDDGVILTNRHVVKDADDIRVVLRDRREYEAKVLIADERTDLAILKLQDVAQKLPTVSFGNSDAVEIGDLVLAIGNPFGVGQTVTSGIVSALARTTVDISDYRSFIQTDAAINPGNSGGALVSMDGKLIGINTAIFSGSGGSHGIGFAIPSNMAAAVLRSALSGEPLVRPWLGFDGKAVDWDMAGALGMDAPHGVIVESVYPDGPADRAGIKSGDIVETMDGIAVEDMQSLRFRAATKEPGKAVALGVMHDGGIMPVTLTLAAPPETPEKDPFVIKQNVPIAGAEFVNLSPALNEELNIPSQRSGVMAVKIARGGPADRIGMRPGDILVSINGEKIDLTEDLRQLLKNPPRGWQIVINRNGEQRRIELR